jgi:single-stranded DNA-specific DHH superfamily exonuclease
MEKIEFMAGNEKRFYDFIGKLGSERVALISHTDLDGLVSAKVVNKVVDVNFMKFVGYHALDKNLVNELKNEKVKKVIFTDISVENILFLREIEKFADVLIIDHHTFQHDLNSTNTSFINAQGYSSAYLCHYLFSKIQKIEGLDWIVVCASISDWMLFKGIDWLSETYRKYGDRYVNDEAILRKGKLWDLQYILSLVLIYFKDNLNMAYDFIPDEIDKVPVLEVYAKKVREEIENQSKLFNKQREIIGDIYFWIINPKYDVREIVVNSLSRLEKDKVYIVAQRRGRFYHISARRQDKKINLPEMLRSLTKGFQEATAGGHIPAAGCLVLSKDIDEFRERLKKI